MMKIINPATEEVLREWPEDTRDTVAEKYALLRDAQPAWAARPLEDRLAVLEKFNRLLEERRDELAATLTAEMGKPLKQARNEIGGARARIAWFLENAPKWLADEWVTKEGATREMISYEPLGVIGNISAWNYPYLVGVNVFVPALLAGNTVLYKPSELATLTGLAIDRLLKESGIPENCFQTAAGGAPVGGMLTDLPLDGYFFTGSYKTGQAIARTLAGRLVPVQLELGGKDPLYVADDVADLAAVAASALEGVVYNNGQSCCAVERIYVHRNVYDAFAREYVRQARELKVGDPMAADTDLGPLARKPQLEFLTAQVEDALAKGAKLAAGGAKKSGKGYFFDPAVLLDADNQMSIMREESFGPIVGIQPVDSDDQAVALMQDTEYGLTAAVYSKSFERARQIMRKMQTGTVYWNCCDRVSASLPWSGRKNSGIGSTLSYQGIRVFTQPKSWHLRS